MNEGTHSVDFPAKTVSQHGMLQVPVSTLDLKQIFITRVIVHDTQPRASMGTKPSTVSHDTART